MEEKTWNLQTPLELKMVELKIELEYYNTIISYLAQNYGDGDLENDIRLRLYQDSRDLVQSKIDTFENAINKPNE